MAKSKKKDVKRPGSKMSLATPAAHVSKPAKKAKKKK